MSQQVLDLRRPVQAARRHKLLIGIMAALGLLLGGAYTVVKPPMVTSTALVLLPSSAPSMATQVVIANSDPVLGAALPHVSPPRLVTELRSDVRIKSLTSYVISVTAKGKTAAEAENTANAVASSYIAAVTPRFSPVGHVQARILARASYATDSRLSALINYGLIGLLAGALIGVLVALVIGRRDLRLRERDDIANSLGIPVLASIPVQHPSDAASWTMLLENYKPAAVDAWQLRMALQQLGMADHTHPLYNGDSGSFSVTVLSLSCDPRALALGPQLAVFAATHGIPTALVIGPQQDMDVVAALHTACVVPSAASSKRSALLRIAVSDDGDDDRQPNTTLTVVVAVVDSQAPVIPDTLRTTATVIGVSAAAATAEQLAMTAVAAAADGREVTGIFVADPESLDRTSGRGSRPVQPVRRKQPARAQRLVTEIKRLPRAAVPERTSPARRLGPGPLADGPGDAAVLRSGGGH